MTSISIFRTSTVLLAAASASVSCSSPDPVPQASAECFSDGVALGTYVALPSGSFTFGDGALYANEGPPVTLHIDEFALLAHEVTNAEFERFVSQTGFVTDAERSAKLGDKGAGSAVFNGDNSSSPWQLVAGATWREPDGPGSSLAGLENFPVVHVSLRDAMAYAEWAGARLPTAEEWEYAAARGLPDPRDAQSGAYGPEGEPRSNTWQGVFPVVDEARDGFAGPAPVGCFPADRTGVHDLIGNVWEWTTSPVGPEQAVIKGGSYLCSDSYCRRFRPAAWQAMDKDFSASHVGFRTVRDKHVPMAKSK